MLYSGEVKITVKKGKDMVKKVNKGEHILGKRGYAFGKPTATWLSTLGDAEDSDCRQVVLRIWWVVLCGISLWEFGQVFPSFYQ